MNDSIFSRVGVRRAYELLTRRSVEGPPHLMRAHLRCPSASHNDEHPSCDLDLFKNVWHCRACGAGGGVAHMIVAAGKARDHAEAARWLEEKLDAPHTSANRKGRIVAEYPYHDENRVVLYVVERREPKSFLQKVPEGDGWRYRLDGARRVPYRLPELRDAIARGETIYVVEGEKDADALVKLGLCATTSAQGSAWKWPAAWGELFRDAKRVVVLPDCDAQGRKAAQQRASIIAMVCDDVRIPDLAPRRNDHYDVSDWLSEGHARDELLAVADAAPRIEAHAQSDALEGGDGIGKLVTIRASEVHAQRITWFARGRIPFGAMTLLDGPGDIGKTTTLMGIIAAASIGRSFFDEEAIEPVTSLIVVEEDSLGVLKMRLRVAGADLNRVHFITGSRVGEATEPFTLPGHVAELEDKIAETGARLVYVDALFSHLDLEGEGRMPQHVRRALRPVVEMLGRTGVAFAAVRHWTKGNGPAAMRALGSVELGNVARSVLSFGRHPDDDARFVIATTKHNLSKPAPTVAYRIEALSVQDDDEQPCEAIRAMLEGEAPDVTADDLAMRQPGDPDERSAAEDWLTDYLGDGEWHASAEVYKAARKDGTGSPQTIRRAATRLGVERDRSGFPSRSKWRLTAVRSQFAHSQGVSKLEQSGEQTGATAASELDGSEGIDEW